MASNGTIYFQTKLSILEVYGTKLRLTNVLTNGSPEIMKEQRLGFEIAHVCFVEVGDSVLGALCLEFL